MCIYIYIYMIIEFLRQCFAYTLRLLSDACIEREQRGLLQQGLLRLFGA